MLLFAEVMEDLYNYVNPLNDRHSPMISKETLDIVLANKDVSLFPIKKKKKSHFVFSIYN